MSQATLHTENGKAKTSDVTAKKSLPLASDLDIETELAKFEAEERARLGLDKQEQQWLETMANAQFTSRRAPQDHAAHRRPHHRPRLPDRRRR